MTDSLPAIGQIYHSLETASVKPPTADMPEFSYEELIAANDVEPGPFYGIGPQKRPLSPTEEQQTVDKKPRIDNVENFHESWSDPAAEIVFRSIDGVMFRASRYYLGQCW